jgi:hypothetical protein
MSKKKEKVFVMRMSNTTKDELIKLSANDQFRYNNTAVVENLIHEAYLLTLENNEK